MNRPSDSKTNSQPEASLQISRQTIEELLKQADLLAGEGKREEEQNVLKQAFEEIREMVLSKSWALLEISGKTTTRDKHIRNITYQSERRLTLTHGSNIYYVESGWRDTSRFPYFYHTISRKIMRDGVEIPSIFMIRHWSSRANQCS